MDFLNYLKLNDVVDGPTVARIRDEAAINKTSVFYELYKRYDDPVEEIIPYNLLVTHLEAAAAAAGQHVISVEGTMGFSLDKSVYDALGGVSESIADMLIPIINLSDGQAIAVTNRPDDENLCDRLNYAYRGKSFKFGVASRSVWDVLFREHVEPILFEVMASQMSTIGRGPAEQVKDSEARRFYHKIMNVGLQRRASDVHFLPCSEYCEVLFRIDGDNRRYTKIPLDILEKICNILKSDGKVAVRKPYEPVDGKVRFSPSNGQKPGDEVDMRISIIPTKRGPDLNVRYLSSRLFTFEELGMTPMHMEDYKSLLSLPSGLIVQVGPTGSGKSTTLYAGLSYIHQSLRNIITAEDPVEILMDGISQIDVDHQNRLTFADALTASLRHDPDVIVVGELRDSETASLAVSAANTGHLVLTSLHTNDSIGVFERLIKLGIDSYSLGEVLVAIMGQRLVKRLCPKCKKAYEVSLRSDTARLYRLPEQDSIMTFYKPVGCVHCENTGYRGRIAINEVLFVTPKIRDMIQRHALRYEFEEELRRTSFQSMFSDGISKAIAGITSLEELEKFARDPIAFKG